MVEILVEGSRGTSREFDEFQGNMNGDEVEMEKFGACWTTIRYRCRTALYFQRRILILSLIFFIQPIKSLSISFIIPTLFLFFSFSFPILHPLSL